MDGVLVIDKPAGPTSHDVVARVRRVCASRRIGHTGTLDPFATGVLPLVIGRATRLAQFLSASDKSYDAVVHLGFATDTYDCTGERAAGVKPGPLPDRAAIEGALDRFRGTFLQTPPRFSAKKIRGVRAHETARGGGDPVMTPLSVTVRTLEVTGVEAPRVSLRLICSAGFYVRALAHDLGAGLGCGGHLESLRRTCAGEFDLSKAVTLDSLEQEPGSCDAALLPMSGLLAGMPAAVLAPSGIRRALHGNALSGIDIARTGDLPAGASGRMIRLLDPSGALVGIARTGEGADVLHPVVVLG